MTSCKKSANVRWKMKLNEVTETGFYTGELDTERETIFEVIKNTDEVWLKETPEQTLLIDEWTYEYTDEDGRKHYEIYGGNLIAVVNAEPFDVVKITDTKYTMDVSDPTIASKCNSTSMMEDKPTRLEIAEQQLEQLKKSNKELKKENDRLNVELSKVYEDIKLSPLCYKCDEEECLQKEINQLKAENEKLKKQVEVFTRQLENAKFIGIEKDEKYFNIAENRISESEEVKNENRKRD